MDYIKYIISAFFVLFAIVLSELPLSAYNADFTPEISVREEYSDNIYLEEDNTRSDYITTISPGFLFEVIGKKRRLEISYNPGFSYYKNNPQSDSIRHRFSIFGVDELTKNTTLEISDWFLRTEDPVDENLLEEGDLTVRENREPYSINIATIGINHRFKELNQFSLEYTNRILENDDEIYADSMRHSLLSSLDYWFDSRFGFETEIFYTMGRIDEFFEHAESDDFNNISGRIRLIRSFNRQFQGFIQYAHTVMNYEDTLTDSVDYQIYDPSIGVNYSFSEDSFIAISIGYFIQDRKNRSDESGVSVSGDLGKTWTLKRGSINCTGTSGYNETYFGAENLGFDVFYQLGSTAEYDITKHLQSNLSFMYREDKYVNRTPERKDVRTRAGTGFTYTPKRWLSVRFNYSYSVVDSTIDASDYEENRMSIMCSLSPLRSNR